VFISIGNMLRGWPDTPHDVWNLFSLEEWLKSEVCVRIVVSARYKGCEGAGEARDFEIETACAERAY
jgi:hypothetical protein